jgi:hypothetical protein
MARHYRLPASRDVPYILYIKKKPALLSSAGFSQMRSLYGYDILSLGTFLALSYSELDFLAFSQSFEA